MRFIGLLLVVAVAGLACENQTPASGGKPSISTVEGSRVLDGNDTRTNATGSVAAAATAPEGLPTAAPALAKAASESDRRAGHDGIKEPMDDAVPVTDRSGAAGPVPEQAGSEGMEVELEE
jgi:hypothetical protein